MSDWILHHYWPSPFAHKTRMALGLAGLEWHSVEIPRVPPKPLLMPLTAGYRRTPVLQRGADIYCDTQNIARALAETDAIKQSLFPHGAVESALMHSEWIDQTVFALAVRVVITTSLESAPADFIQDRGDLYFGSHWSTEGLKADLPGVILQLNSALQRLEDLSAVRVANDALVLSYADIAIAYLAWFIRGRWPDGPACLSRYPSLCHIESAVDALGHGQDHPLEAEQALTIAKAATPQSKQGIALPTQFSLGQWVGVRPFLNSSDPEVVGRLRYLDAQRVSIDHDDAQVGAVAVHFPVAGYQIRAAHEPG